MVMNNKDKGPKRTFETIEATIITEPENIPTRTGTRFVKCAVELKSGKRYPLKAFNEQAEKILSMKIGDKINGKASFGPDDFDGGDSFTFNKFISDVIAETANNPIKKAISEKEKERLLELIKENEKKNIYLCRVSSDIGYMNVWLDGKYTIETAEGVRRSKVEFVGESIGWDNLTKRIRDEGIDYKNGNTCKSFLSLLDKLIEGEPNETITNSEGQRDI